MSIRKTDVVDWLGIEKGTGVVILTVSDDEDWTNEDEHIELLQQKLNTYLAFTESGEVFERLAADVGRSVPPGTPIKVSVLAKHDLPARAREFFAYAETMVKDAGFTLTHKVLTVSP